MNHAVNKITRNSGSVLETNIIMKTCSQALEQGNFMMRYPDIFIPVIHLCDSSYVMPIGECLPSNTGYFCYLSIINKLKSLWEKPFSEGRTRNFINRGRYHDYVMGVALKNDIPPKLRRMADELYLYTKNHSSRYPANFIHGDATLENVLWLYTHENIKTLKFIDPNLRPTPTEGEIDIAKLLQSAFGYESCMTEESLGKLWQVLEKEVVFNSPLCIYYFLTHLIRLWPYQPKKHEWVMEVINSERYKNL